MFHLEIFEEILKLNIGVAQSDNLRLFELLKQIIPMEIHRYSSGTEHNGWVVPHNWQVKKAEIRKDGELLFDGLVHPLAVAGYSCSFSGKISFEELEQRVFTKKSLPDAYPFHCMFNYRPWVRDWGFCIPFNIFKDWTPGDCEVLLETEYLDGEMLVGELNQAGTSDETIVFNAHTCHPCQFNDDLAGVAVLLELFKHLASTKTRYSYKAILAPEHLGTVFYLANLEKSERTKLKCGSFVEMVGIKEELAYQETFFGSHVFDAVAKHVLDSISPNYRQGGFRTIVGNDETVWEAPGIEIPFGSISRCYNPHYYNEYHTSADDLSINSTSHLEQSLNVLKAIVDVFEQDCIIERRFEGLIALSNPKYDLYVERPEPTVDKKLSELQLKLGSMQDALPRYFDGSSSVFQIAQRFSIPFATLLEYIRKFEDCDLVQLTPVPSIDWYKSE